MAGRRRTDPGSVRHPTCRIATTSVSQLGTYRVALRPTGCAVRHSPRRSATNPCRSVTSTSSQCDIHLVAVRHPPRRSEANPRRSVTSTSSQRDQPASHCDIQRVAVRPTPCRIATNLHRIATNPVSLCDQPPSHYDQPGFTVRPNLIAVRPTLFHCETNPHRIATNPASRCDQPSSPCDKDDFAVRRTDISPCNEKIFATPLTSRRGQPRMLGTNPRLERVKGLAANGGTRVLNKDSRFVSDAGVELAPPAAVNRGVRTPRIINRKDRRVSEPSSRWPPRTR